MLEPDGPPVEGAAGDWAGSVRQTENHQYGTFTAAKKRVVEVGRKLSATMALDHAERPNPAAAAIASGDLEESSMPVTSAKKRRRQQKNRKRSRRRRAHVASDAADNNDNDDDEDDDNDDGGGVLPRVSTRPISNLIRGIGSGDCDRDGWGYSSWPWSLPCLLDPPSLPWT